MRSNVQRQYAISHSPDGGLADVLEGNVWKATRKACRVALHMLIDVVSHGKAPGHDAEINVSTVTVAHDIR